MNLLVDRVAYRVDRSIDEDGIESRGVGATVDVNVSESEAILPRPTVPVTQGWAEHRPSRVVVIVPRVRIFVVRFVSPRVILTGGDILLSVQIGVAVSVGDLARLDFTSNVDNACVAIDHFGKLLPIHRIITLCQTIRSGRRIICLGIARVGGVIGLAVQIEVEFLDRVSRQVRRRYAWMGQGGTPAGTVKRTDRCAGANFYRSEAIGAL